MPSQSNMLNALPIQIADRFLGTILGLCHGIVVALVTFLDGFVTVVFSGPIIMGELLSHAYAAIKAKGLSSTSALFITSLLLLPFALGIVVGTSFAMIALVINVVQLFISSIGRGLLNGSDKVWLKIKSDCKEVAQLIELRVKIFLSRPHINALKASQHQILALMQRIQALQAELDDLISMTQQQHIVTFVDVPLAAYQNSLQDVYLFMIFLNNRMDYLIVALKNTFVEEDYELSKVLLILQSKLIEEVARVLQAWARLNELQSQIDRTAFLDQPLIDARAQALQELSNLLNFQPIQNEPLGMTQEEFTAFELTGEDLEAIRHCPLSQEQQQIYAASEDTTVKDLFARYQAEHARLEEACCITMDQPQRQDKVVLVKQAQTIAADGQSVQWLPAFTCSTIFDSNMLKKHCFHPISAAENAFVIMHPITRDLIFSRDENRQPAPVKAADGSVLSTITRYRYHRYQPTQGSDIYSGELTLIAKQLTPFSTLN